MQQGICNPIQNFMEIWNINLRKSLEIQTSLIHSDQTDSFSTVGAFCTVATVLDES